MLQDKQLAKKEKIFPHTIQRSSAKGGNVMKVRNATLLILLVLLILCHSFATAAPGRTLPTVSITSPASGTTYTTAGTVTITATASDYKGVSKVEFYDNYDNRTTLKATYTMSPFTYTWTFTSVNNGIHSWTAKAYDKAGNSKVSSAVSLTVNIGVADTTPDQFTFTDQTGAALNTVVTSNTITVTGINAAASISIADGTYSVNGGAYTSASGTVTNGAMVTVHVTSSASYSTTVNATLTIGGVSDTFSVTTQAASPTDSILINNGATYTNSASVTLSLSCTGTGGTCTQMQFSNDNVSWSAAETYAAAKVWTLTTGDGTKTVYAKFRDNAGNWSIVCSDSIIIDTTPPNSSLIINYSPTYPNGAPYTNSTLVTLTLSSSDATSGVSYMCISNTPNNNIPPCPT